MIDSDGCLHFTATFNLVLVNYEPNHDSQFNSTNFEKPLASCMQPQLQNFTPFHFVLFSLARWFAIFACWNPHTHKKYPGFLNQYMPLQCVVLYSCRLTSLMRYEFSYRCSYYLPARNHLSTCKFETFTWLQGKVSILTNFFGWLAFKTRCVATNFLAYLPYFQLSFTPWIFN